MRVQLRNARESAEAMVQVKAKQLVRVIRVKRLVQAEAFALALKVDKCLFKEEFPKRGFNNIFAKKIVAINVSDLNKFEDGAEVDAQALVNAGIVKKEYDGIKILGNGEISKKLTVKVAAYSESAKQKIEAAGGKAEVV